MKICFVCQGNIIRSPLAEHIFLQLADDDAFSKFKFDHTCQNLR